MSRHTWRRQTHSSPITAQSAAILLFSISCFSGSNGACRRRCCSRGRVQPQEGQQPVQLLGLRSKEPSQQRGTDQSTKRHSAPAMTARDLVRIVDPLEIRSPRPERADPSLCVEAG